MNIDLYLLKMINTEWVHPWLDTFFVSWTDIHKEFIFQLGLLLWFVYLGFKKKWPLLLTILAGFIFSTVADNLADEIIKPFFSRPRPASSDLPFEVIIRGKNSGGYGLPSSHATVAFTLAMFFSLRSWKWAPHLFCLAFLTGYSRIYCGVHFPSDILVGAIIGIIIGLVGSFSLIKIDQR